MPVFSGEPVLGHLYNANNLYVNITTITMGHFDSSTKKTLSGENKNNFTLKKGTYACI
jgi:hypothetical protein